MTPPGDAGGNFFAERRVNPRDVTATVTLFLLFAVALPVAEELCSFNQTTTCLGVVVHRLGVFKYSINIVTLQGRSQSGTQGGLEGNVTVKWSPEGEARALVGVQGHALQKIFEISGYN